MEWTPGSKKKTVRTHRSFDKMNDDAQNVLLNEKLTFLSLTSSVLQDFAIRKTNTAGK